MMCSGRGIYRYSVPIGSIYRYFSNLSLCCSSGGVHLGVEGRHFLYIMRGDEADRTYF